VRVFGRGPVHDPERDASLFVQGEMGDRDRRRFEAHLLACEECWREVQRSRAGRALAERARELSPPGLRQDIRAAVAMSEAPPRRRPRVLVPLVAASALALVGSGILVADLVRGHAPTQPRAIAAALSSFRSARPPLAKPTVHTPPDLGTAGLVLVDSGRASLGGLPVDEFWFTTGSTRVVLFLASVRFPEAVGATERAGTLHGWRAAEDGVHLVCADSPVSYLLMSRDVSLVHRAEAALRRPAAAPGG
jgi:hypothetical protein